jgi:ABC-type uncharacterized transport system involved in gliding motility auxiliary subunit
MSKRIFNALSWVGVALVAAAVAVQWRLPDYDRYARYAALAGLALVVLYVVSQWREIAAQFQKKNTRYGTIASVSVIIVLGLLIAVNYLSNRRNKRWDLTANRQYSLSDQSVKLLQGLKSPARLIVFDQEPNFDRFRTRLTEYAYNSPQVKVEYIDPDKTPVKAREYKVEQYGTIVVEYMGRTERITNNTEQDVTGALIKVINPQSKKVYFLSGHGEKDPANSERGGYSSIADSLKRDNYQFDKLVLAQQELPKDATVIAVAGPKTDLLPGEGDALKKYLAGGGHVLLMLDPPDNDAAMPVIDGLLKEWSIVPGNDVVVDVSGVGQLLGTDASVPVAAKYGTHPITTNFNVLTAYPLARSMTAAPGAPAGKAPQTFIETSPRSWAETNVKELRASGKVELNEKDGDKPGPVSIGVAVSAPVGDATKDPKAKPEGEDAAKPETRLVAIGDSDFATNATLGIQGNRDMFMNTVNWLAQQENLISIRPREPSDSRLTLTTNITSAIFWLSIFIIPAAVLGTGVASWWRRR